MTDEAGRARSFADGLSLPGLLDLHTHFLPPRVMVKVRAQFDAAGPLIGRPPAAGRCPPRTPVPVRSPHCSRHPRLRLVVAHAGAPEYDEFLHLAETHERVALDTTMAFTPFFEEMGGAYPPGLLPRLRDLGLAGKVHLGSDFPHIPYPYADQLDALARLELGEEWLRAVCWANTAALLDQTGEKFSVFHS